MFFSSLFLVVKGEGRITEELVQYIQISNCNGIIQLNRRSLLNMSTKEAT
jgi:hypothetical protein